MASGSPPPHNAPLEVLGERLHQTMGLSRSLTLGLLWFIISVSAAFLISPSLYSQQIPELKASDVGKPFRAASANGFKASRDYDIVHTESTEQRRLEARAAVRPVFDYDPSVHQGVTKDVQETFARLRSLLAEEPTPEKKRLKEAFEDKVVVPEGEDFEALLASRFSLDVEQVVLSLVERAYLSYIVSSREDPAREGVSGITIRVLGGRSEHSSTVMPPSVLDAREAQAALDQFVSVPGNLPQDWPASLRRALLRFAKLQVRANLFFNAEETRNRRDTAAAGVQDAIISIKKGQKVIGDGELVTSSHLVILRGMGTQRDPTDLLMLQVGGAVLVALLLAAAFIFFRSSFNRFRPTRKDGILVGALLIGTLATTRLWVVIVDALHDRYPVIPVEALYFLAPVCAGAMLTRFLLTELLALYFSVVVSVLSALLFGNSLTFGVFTLLTSLVGAERVGRAKDRLGILKAGMATGLVGANTVFALALAEGKGISVETAISVLAVWVGGVLAAPMVVTAVTPLIEGLFGYASDIKLVELANLNHPALKELIVQAPGTYHHSIIIGSLVEAAAEAIGANPLLARSCAYYHDIGKGKNPLYFGENQKGENRHDTLAPAMSAVIIKRHVTEGMEMARQYKLPKKVADAIPQHHGTRSVGYFLHKAIKEQEGKENPQPIDETIYRYSGPKPQFREAALVMIADAVEAASRAMPDPTSAKLQALVQKLINGIFSEGQLDECELTLKDLQLIAQSFARTLEGIYHARPPYPPGAVAAAGGMTSAGRPLELRTDPKRVAGG